MTDIGERHWPSITVNGSPGKNIIGYAVDPRPFTSSKRTRYMRTGWLTYHADGKMREASPAMRACPEALLLAFGVVKT